MARRQAHGTSLTAQPSKKAKRKAKARSKANALDAFAIAAKQYETGPRGYRARELDIEAPGKHTRADSEEDDDEPLRKRARPSRRDESDNEFDGGGGGGGGGGSDSDGLEWKIGVDSDDDSELDSDEAFGESDEEELGISRMKRRPQNSNSEAEGSDGDNSDLESLGSEAIDLATALDQWEEDSSEEEIRNGAEDDDSGTEGDSEDTTPSSDGEEEITDNEDEDDEDEADPAKYDALRDLIGNLPTKDGNAEGDEPQGKKKAAVSLKDLGLSAIADPHIKNSLKLMKKEAKSASKAGASKKLDVPLARRQQDKLDRSVAYEKTNETLERWQETVKHNRRAEHLVFPLAQNEPGHGLDHNNLALITEGPAGNELEAAIMSIMEESGLGPSAPREARALNNSALEANKPPRAQIKAMNAEKRKERELKSREEARAKRIKKIKSKAYHRVHKKAEQRKQMAEIEALAEAGEDAMPLDEQEREELDRQRAMARVGNKHKESKWAKRGAKAGRGVWDEDYRTGMKELVLREQELRKRVEGKGGGADTESGSEKSDSEDSGDAKERLLRQIDELQQDDYEPTSMLMKQPFMIKAEARRKAENDRALAQLRRELNPEMADSSDEEVDVGRRSYGLPGKKVGEPIPVANDEDDDAGWTDPVPPRTTKNLELNTAAAHRDLNGIEMAPQTMALIAKPERIAGGLRERLKAEAKEAKANAAKSGLELHVLQIDDETSSSEEEDEQGGDDNVAAEFAKEKEALMEEQGDKEVDETLAGWGSWVGLGVSKNQRARHKGRFLKKIEGVDRKKRKDWGKDKVLIKEGTAKKNIKYMASQLPHPFESKDQYERSLRLPVGKEWVTKETFQGATKPRVIIKQGVIAPMSKPMYQ